jgi:hypothetical protein
VIKDKTIPFLDLTAIYQISRCTEVFVSKKKKNSNSRKGKEEEKSEEPSNLEELSSSKPAKSVKAAATSKELEEELSVTKNGEALRASSGAGTNAKEELHQKLPPTNLEKSLSVKAAATSKELEEQLSVTNIGEAFRA